MLLMSSRKVSCTIWVSSNRNAVGLFWQPACITQEKSNFVQWTQAVALKDVLLKFCAIIAMVACSTPQLHA